VRNLNSTAWCRRPRNGIACNKAVKDMEAHGALAAVMEAAAVPEREASLETLAAVTGTALALAAVTGTALALAAAVTEREAALAATPPAPAATPPAPAAAVMEIPPAAREAQAGTTAQAAAPRRATMADMV